MAKLTKKQIMFCEYYLKTQNQTRSAVDAGYSEKCAHVTSHRLLKQDNVKMYLKNRIKKEVKSEVLSANEVLGKLSIIASKEVVPKDIRPSDVLKALEHLGKFHKLFVDVVEDSEADKYSELVNRMRENINESMQ